MFMHLRQRTGTTQHVPGLANRNGPFAAGEAVLLSVVESGAVPRGVWKRFLPSGLAPSGLLQGRCGPRVAPLSSPNSRQGRDDGKSEQKTPRPIPRPGRGRGRRAAGRGAFLL